MVTAINRHRAESPERWAKALQRAIEHGVEVFVSAVDGQRFATSATQLDTLYPVDAYSCACPAALAGDPVCQHRAALRIVLGWIALDDVSTETPATIDCGACHGCGWNYVETNGGRTFPDQITCRRCGGSGQMPVRIVRASPATSLAAD